MKKIAGILSFFILFFCLSISVFALENLQESEIDVKDFFPNETVEHFKENGIESFDFETLLELDIKDMFAYLKNLVKNEISAPFLLMYAVFVVVIITSLTSSINGGFLNAEIQKNFSAVGVLCVGTTIATPIISCLEQAREFVSSVSSFVEVFVPSISAVMFASGHSNTAVGYQATMMIAVELISAFLCNTIIPLLYMFLAFSIVSKIAGEYNIDLVSKTIKSFVTWSLTFVMTAFVALITIKGIIGAGVDSVALRTGRFFVGSLVPAVGAALAEAASTLQKSMGLIKSTSGVFGILAIIFYFIPPLVKVLVFKITCSISSSVGELLGAEKIASVLREVTVVLNLICSVILSYAAMLILSTAVILCVGNEG